MSTMKAAVIHEAGGPEVLKVESRPIPTPRAGEVLIRVKAFGLNRSEMFTRQGHSPGVKFPRSSASRPSAWSRGARGRVPQGRNRRDRDGRHGTAVRRGLRRIYLRAFNTRCKSSGPNSPGRHSAPSRRCCKRLGARCSSRFVSRRASGC